MLKENDRKMDNFFQVTISKTILTTIVRNWQLPSILQNTPQKTTKSPSCQNTKKIIRKLERKLK